MRRLRIFSDQCESAWAFCLWAILGIISFSIAFAVFAVVLRHLNLV